MSGFFSKKETESKTRPEGKKYSCTACGLFKDAETPKMQIQGKFRSQILVIGDFPNSKEDAAGKLWIDHKGDILKSTLQECGINLYKDCYSLNSVNCTPHLGLSEKLDKHKIACCRKVIVSKVIEQYKPKLIITLGTYALYSVIGNRWKKDFDDIYKWRGFTIPDRDLNCWICPTFSPAWISSGNENQDFELIFKQDIKRAVDKLFQPLPPLHIPRINVIEDLSIIDKFETITEMAAFDYEATGLKPYNKKQEILTASIAVSIDNVFVFKMPKTEEQLLPFINFLKNKNIKKVAANMKYEDTWSKVKLKTTVRGWIHDTMLAAHQLDNRPGVTGLKFQVYVNFGVVDYDEEVAPHLKAPDDNPNSLNKLKEFMESSPENENKVLTYNAWDSIWEYRLALVQMETINNSIKPF
jgi:uracil-DNA glycosylase family 4